jgi:hypothetical protein
MLPAARGLVDRAWRESLPVRPAVHCKGSVLWPLIHLAYPRADAVKPLRIAVGIFAAAVLAACGSSGAPSNGAIGKTARVADIKLTLKQFSDPARGSGTHNEPPAGTRFVAIRFKVFNPGQAQGFSADDIAVVTTNSEIYPTYNSDPVSVTGCPHFDDTDTFDGGPRWSVASNATISACTVFELPVGVKVAQVIFAFSGQFTPVDTTTLLWTLLHSLKAVPKDLVAGTLELVRSRPVHGVYAAINTKAPAGTVQIFRSNEGNGNNVAGNVYDAAINVGPSGHFSLSLPPGSWQVNATLYLYLQGPNGVRTGIEGGGSFTVRSGLTHTIIIQLSRAHAELNRVLQTATDV